MEWFGEHGVQVMLAVDSRNALAVFFGFIHTYLDHGGVYFARFPVRSPRSGGTLQAPLLPSAQACPKKKVCAQRKSQRKMT